jgi:hypothetical protein
MCTKYPKFFLLTLLKNGFKLRKRKGFYKKDQQTINAGIYPINRFAKTSVLREWLLSDSTMKRTGDLTMFDGVCLAQTHILPTTWNPLQY